jgi:hypothetical protein
MTYGEDVVHTFSTEQHTSSNPSLLEIRKDGQDFWYDKPECKQKFRFGVVKAKVLISCLETLKEFVNHEGNISTCKIKKSYELDPYKISVTVYRSPNTHNQEKGPYLQFRYNEKSIGIGLQKAEAVIELEDEIRAFIYQEDEYHGSGIDQIIRERVVFPEYEEDPPRGLDIF